MMSVMIRPPRWGWAEPRERRRVGPFCFEEPALLCLALGVLFCADASGWLRLSLLASLLHEAGHILVYRLLTGRAPRIRVSALGMCLYAAGDGLPPGKTAVLAAAGPAANLLAAGGCFAAAGHSGAVLRLAFGTANLLIGGFNLLPVPPLDGSVLAGWAAGRIRKLQLHGK